ncbi:helix-turn-helix domain-containing protein [Chryseobacterium chendengshani]|uniref:helix-turn-helix domain-containing protein n=1 Tax=Chryseobacterium sp. LJ756 TaxID=2864113 RepID=UPI001C64026D|nr:helix-turn-helix transcriptional regulator [Chryseobacterium sp. LJ756]MBW7675811.1 helix-turn-helix domain-containing protein [Chryseobacterium sp. LJ756]
MEKKLTEKNLGFKLRKLREKKGVSQQTLAIDLGVSQSKISKIENGTEKITVPYFIEIFTYFSLSPDEMIEFLKEKVIN